MSTKMNIKLSRILKYWYRGYRDRFFGEKEIELIQLIGNHIGADLAFDIGSNVGIYTFNMERKFKRVVAVDPVRSCVDFLNTVTRNSTSVLECAVSSHAGKVTMNLPIDQKNNEITALASVLGKDTDNILGSTFEVQATTIDWLINSFGIPNLVKIDIEGHEYNILDGLKRCIKNIENTVFIIEVEERHSGKPVIHFFREMSELGFDTYSYCGGTLKKVFPLCHSSNEIIVGQYNFVFMSKSTYRNFVSHV